MSGGRDGGGPPEVVLVPFLAAALGAVIVLAAVEWPLLAWSSLHGDPELMDVGTAIGGGLRWLIEGTHADPRTLDTWTAYRDVLPPPPAWVALDALLLAGLMFTSIWCWMRVDRWRGRRYVALARWDPRSWVKPRSWARPRDLIHLQHPSGRTGWVRRALTALVRVCLWDWRTPEPPGAGGWPVGRLRGGELRSESETHLMTVAPTRSGKTTRVLIPALLEHSGPAVVLSNKTDVLQATATHRARTGPVWIYAPMSSQDSMPVAPCGWTPLAGCEAWEFALRMGRWIFDADPSASTTADESGGARFYNREAVAVALPPLLHAAALEGRGMAAVHDWLRSGVVGLDEPRAILAARDARQAADAVAGVQGLDDRPRSLLLMSAAQLVDAYRFPSVQAADRQDFRPADLLAGGTLYLIAPDSEQELLAPLFGGLLGSTLRVWEERAADGRGEPPLRILADEAAHLAPLAKLPSYLAVSGGWGVRWCLVYQSLAQLQHRYGRDADTVLGNVLCKLFLGPIQDEATRRYLRDLLDEETVTASSWTAGALGTPTSTTRHERETAKVSAQRLMQLREGEAVLVHRRDLPAVTSLPAWWQLIERPRRGRR